MAASAKPAHCLNVGAAQLDPRRQPVKPHPGPFWLRVAIVSAVYGDLLSVTHDLVTGSSPEIHQRRELLGLSVDHIYPHTNRRNNPLVLCC